ncbi:unnamed protein product [Mytilus coruscus]|uniref:Uncharacterized protein n=1 Tax=Mytilus coruscus TaxID=42192 RepID=A0A6J8DDV1_MYTCO|nr:unnamed protein product [Mytilus coruscus]
MTMVLEDVRGQPLPAIDVFSLSIKALKDHLNSTVEIKNIVLDDEKTKWVLTVPAIWTDTAKQFMRKSAEKAGIPRDMLTIALEPEAASIYCQTFPSPGCREIAEIGSKYMVVDLGGRIIPVGKGLYMQAMLNEDEKFCKSDNSQVKLNTRIEEEIDLDSLLTFLSATTEFSQQSTSDWETGGTIDVTVHEKLPNGTLKEVPKASGNGCGGTSVDDEFIQMFHRIFGGPLLNSLKSENPEAYLYLLRSIENVKRTFQPAQSRKVNLTIPYGTLDELCKSNLGEDIKNVISSSSLGSKIQICTDKLRIEPLFAKSLFKTTCDNIIASIQSVLQQGTATNVSSILLVGGFAGCKMVQNALKAAFPGISTVLQDDSSVIVFKGAVLFGYKSDFISSRIARYTYGIELSIPFDKIVHDQKRKELIQGENYCSGIFNPFMKINTSIPKGHKTNQVCYTECKTGCHYKVYYTDKENVMYTDTGECTLLGEFDIFFTNLESQKRK